eukprot:CAMPEP_0170516458 /NCGR_PEP_ID=MMETSP0209-20121228/2658_1 /TAXON_ID=665100 ORGANISM="Litonotus pictus, Strain P1" /NCGR_SAMPLE_ID=MMETSP0209 /ASSEMBLY_ACC=CAM_ASM_000301 /LENGTH=1070 /DNA_ID=CAMNT_0010801345 /DNA_START=506 /DNA_END=3715 /DNA_ORIENTATION=+
MSNDLSSPATAFEYFSKTNIDFEYSGQNLEYTPIVATGKYSVSLISQEEETGFVFVINHPEDTIQGHPVENLTVNIINQTFNNAEANKQFIYKVKSSAFKFHLRTHELDDLSLLIQSITFINQNGNPNIVVQVPSNTNYFKSDLIKSSSGNIAIRLRDDSIQTGDEPLKTFEAFVTDHSKHELYEVYSFIRNSAVPLVKRPVLNPEVENIQLIVDLDKYALRERDSKGTIVFSNKADEVSYGLIEVFDTLASALAFSTSGKELKNINDDDFTSSDSQINENGRISFTKQSRERYLLVSIDIEKNDKKNPSERSITANIKPSPIKVNFVDNTFTEVYGIGLTTFLIDSSSALNIASKKNLSILSSQANNLYFSYGKIAGENRANKNIEFYESEAHLNAVDEEKSKYVEMINLNQEELTNETPLFITAQSDVPQSRRFSIYSNENSIIYYPNFKAYNEFNINLQKGEKIKILAKSTVGSNFFGAIIPELFTDSEVSIQYSQDNDLPEIENSNTINYFNFNDEEDIRETTTFGDITIADEDYLKIHITAKSDIALGTVFINQYYTPSSSRLLSQSKLFLSDKLTAGPTFDIATLEKGGLIRAANSKTEYSTNGSGKYKFEFTLRDGEDGQEVEIQIGEETKTITFTDNNIRAAFVIDDVSTTTISITPNNNIKLFILAEKEIENMNEKTVSKNSEVDFFNGPAIKIFEIKDMKEFNKVIVSTGDNIEFSKFQYLLKEKKEEDNGSLFFEDSAFDNIERESFDKARNVVEVGNKQKEGQPKKSIYVILRIEVAKINAANDDKNSNSIKFNEVNHDTIAVSLTTSGKKTQVVDVQKDQSFVRFRVANEEPSPQPNRKTLVSINIYKPMNTGVFIEGDSISSSNKSNLIYYRDVINSSEFTFRVGKEKKIYFIYSLISQQDRDAVSDFNFSQIGKRTTYSPSLTQDKKNVIVKFSLGQKYLDNLPDRNVRYYGLIVPGSNQTKLNFYETYSKLNGQNICSGCIVKRFTTSNDLTIEAPLDSDKKYSAVVFSEDVVTGNIVKYEPVSLTDLPERERPSPPTPTPTPTPTDDDDDDGL